MTVLVVCLLVYGVVATVLLLASLFRVSEQSATIFMQRVELGIARRTLEAIRDRFESPSQRLDLLYARWRQ